jgi:UDP-N-acetylglucosamine 3-dehydrogenase
MMRMIRVGVVGVGAMGQHHARLYRQLGCELFGVADADSGRAKAIAEQYGTKHFDDYRDLISKVDAVSIAVPTVLHHEVAMDFLREGIHCLVEKPIAPKTDQAKEMVMAAEDSGVVLAVGHIERFNPAVVALKRTVSEGRLGKILQVSTRRVGPFVPRIRDVGIVIDSATHDIGVVRYLLGMEPISVFSRVGRLQHTKEDHAIIVLSFMNSTACIEVNWFTPHKVRTLVATGSEGIAYLDYIEQTLTVCSSGEVVMADIQKVEPLKAEIQDFLDSVARGRKPAVDGVEGTAILRIALAAVLNDFRALPTIEPIRMR